MEASNSHPYPPFELAMRVLTIPEDGSDPFLSYEVLGSSTRYELLKLLPDDWSFEGRKVLDFGCGAGRTLRHFLAEASRPDTEFWGADIDEKSIGWLEANLSPPLRLINSETEPPLPLERDSFDLAWAISVFTHLADTSAEWILELHRILKPGGLLMASYMGEWNSEQIAGEPWNENRVGMNVLRHDQGWDKGGPMILTSDWWVREHWGRAFEIVAINPEVHNQTWVLLRKKPVSITAEELLEAGSDPREAASLRHNVVQLQREIEDVRLEVRDRYENTLSWRLTGWLRRSRALVARLTGRLKGRSRS